MKKKKNLVRGVFGGPQNPLKTQNRGFWGPPNTPKNKKNKYFFINSTFFWISQLSKTVLESYFGQMEGLFFFFFLKSHFFGQNLVQRVPKTPKTSNVRPFVNFAQKLTKFFLVAQNTKPPDIGGSGTEKVILLLFWDTLMLVPLVCYPLFSCLLLTDMITYIIQIYFNEILATKMSDLKYLMAISQVKNLLS